MDSSKGSLLSGSDDHEPNSSANIISKNKIWPPLIMSFGLLIIASYFVYTTFTALRSTRSIRFSVESVAYTGLDSAAVPPSFNVTLRARSTHSWAKLCSSGPAAMEVTYAGVTFAMAGVEPFCIDPKEDKVIAAASASPGWTVLPSAFMESMERDRRHGGVQIEVDFTFRSVDKPYDDMKMWVRCPTMLDADRPSSCKSYLIRSC